jgi:hypothetical protein
MVGAVSLFAKSGEIVLWHFVIGPILAAIPLTLRLIALTMMVTTNQEIVVGLQDDKTNAILAKTILLQHLTRQSALWIG